MRVSSRLGLGGGALVALLGVLGAVLGLLGKTGAWQAPGFVPRAFAAVAGLVVLLVLGSLVHVARRRDLARGERFVLAGLLVLVPPGAFLYWGLGPERTRALARRLVALAEPERSAAA